MADLGPWDPLDVAEVSQLFGETTLRWWVSGGRALELHVGRAWRSHADTDVGILRGDARTLRAVLAGWEIWVAADGRLRLWRGEDLHATRAENNLWCRRSPDVPWSVDIPINEGDADVWIFRREPSVRLVWSDAVLRTADGVPYLAPELQLLFKSRDRRDIDERDAREVIPELDPLRRDWLACRLDADHPWQRLLVGP